LFREAILERETGALDLVLVELKTQR
jgi:hypothetical protein